MMNQPSYVQRWKEKVEWYQDNGVNLAQDADGRPLTEIIDGPNGLLVWTDDAGGVNTPAWTDLARAVFRSGGTSLGRRAGSKVARPQ